MDLSKGGQADLLQEILKGGNGQGTTAPAPEKDRNQVLAEAIQARLDKVNGDYTRFFLDWKSFGEVSQFGVGFLQGLGEGFVSSVESVWDLLKLGFRTSALGLATAWLRGDDYSDIKAGVEKAAKVAKIMYDLWYEIKGSDPSGAKQARLIQAVINGDMEGIGEVSPTTLRTFSQRSRKRIRRAQRRQLSMHSSN